MDTGILCVNGINKKSTDLTYEDLTWLYWDFINKYGHVPTTSEGKLKYNLPQQRITKKITSSDGHSYNEFMNQFGKVKHVRTEEKSKYNDYVQKYKQISESVGHGLTIEELTNNTYGLPSAKWFVDNCPDSTVCVFDDFVQWVGFPSNKRIFDKEYVAEKLKQLEIKIGRSITGKDITLENVGFSVIVIKRLWGSLSNCKKELGLMKTIMGKVTPFTVYKTKLDNILNDISNQTDRKIISWKDIENHPEIHLNHKSLVKAFERENLNFFVYVKEKGFLMNPSTTYAYHYTFDDGERVVSALEYEFSLFLRENGYKYNIDYNRDVMYKTFLPFNNKSKMNCDYVFGDKYIEIAGMINDLSDGWDNHKFTTNPQISYQKKMLKKRELLEKNNKQYLFLFPEDFKNDNYKTKFFALINENENKEGVLYA